MKYAPECRRRNHDEQHTDAAVCDAYEAEDRATALGELMAEIAESRQTMVSIREDEKAAEKALAGQIREAFTYGGSATKIAQAAGVSRERVYQIRDGRR